MKWDQYYERFYDWSESTQINRISSLTDFGASEEVAEVIQSFMDGKAASRLIKKALEYGVKFSAQEVMDMIARVFAKTTDIRRSGSAALDMAAIASGRADIFFELILSPWDYAGASVLIEEAGGKIFGLDGKPVQFKEPQAIVVCGEGIDTEELLRLCNG